MPTASRPRGEETRRDRVSITAASPQLACVCIPAGLTVGGQRGGNKIGMDHGAELSDELMVEADNTTSEGDTAR